MELPLKDIKILDLSRVLAGPLATQILADLGATVVKVEKPDSGDETRRWGPPYMEDGSTSAYYLSINRGKRSITADFQNLTDQKRLQQLAGACDIVVENYQPGTLDAYGLGEATLRGLYPKLIYCSITGFGQTGPWRNQPGFDAMIQALGGLMQINGEPNRDPLRVGLPVADILTGLYAVITILAALHRRDKSQSGASIDLALYDALIGSLTNQGTYYLVSGKEPQRTGHRHPSIVPYQLFHARDGAIVIAAGNDRQFLGLCSVLGLDKLSQDLRFRNNEHRVKNAEALVAKLSSTIKERDLESLINALNGANVPCGKVETVGAALSSSQTASRGLVHSARLRSGHEVRLLSSPIVLDGTRLRHPLPPPALGEHDQLNDAELWQ